MPSLTRREALERLAAAGVATLSQAGCARADKDTPMAVDPPTVAAHTPAPVAAVAPDPVLREQALDFMWPTLDPFLFCVHHKDAYPAGNDAMGPAASLQGRQIGQDFTVRDGWRMYHGERVPGFPSHPHRGFETVTVVREGVVDHADSLGAAARYGDGDVQWMTAGRGIVHAEMFPLRQTGAPNPLELFQLWLNLPARDKFTAPYFSMFWAPTVPKRRVLDAAGRAVDLTVVAGSWQDLRPPAPPPESWASKAESDVAIWTLKLAPGATFTLPAARSGTNRMLYFFAGETLQVGPRQVKVKKGLTLRPDLEVTLTAGPREAEVLMLQGRPIGEPVVQYGPFVMNSREEIQQAYADYRRTRFGGWPWPQDDPVHGRQERFARHPDGRVERAG